ncbi:MAG: glycosyl transferase [Betaproteobacteria bacterium HGW-Betaproteobacteria-10]|nr:MAG: glycosyl transferase [Betaproteobacteria bacterium HGW-Betaproteobacteria-10]
MFIAVVGTVGVPGNYGGFETLAQNLVEYHKNIAADAKLSIYCSSRSYSIRPPRYLDATLRYIPLHPNGKQAMFYDMWSILDAVFRGADVVLLLGHGGSFVLPLVRLFFRVRTITNIDGIEWKRSKWSRFARFVIRNSERFAIRNSDVIIADNEAIAEYVHAEFGTNCHIIAYGGDHALATPPDAAALPPLPSRYALALCRIEPENNVGMILEAFAAMPGQPLVFVGNWNSSDYGRGLKARYGASPGLHLLDPIYAPGALRALRDRAWLYVHGHSAGGTNPSLVEMMHFGIPVAAHGCNFNRYTTEGKARYFESAPELMHVVANYDPESSQEIGSAMSRIARSRYTWEAIGRAYFDLMLQP